MAVRKSSDTRIQHRISSRRCLGCICTSRKAGGFDTFEATDAFLDLSRRYSMSFSWKEDRTSTPGTGQAFTITSQAPLTGSPPFV